MITNETYAELQANYPQAVAEVLAKLRKGKHKLKDLPPEAHIWGFEYLDIVNYSETWADRQQKVEDNCETRVFLQVGTTKYFSETLDSVPQAVINLFKKDFERKYDRLWEDSTQPTEEDKLRKLLGSMDYPEEPPTYAPDGYAIELDRCVRMLSEYFTDWVLEGRTVSAVLKDVLALVKEPHDQQNT